MALKAITVSMAAIEFDSGLSALHEFRNVLKTKRKLPQAMRIESTSYMEFSAKS